MVYLYIPLFFLGATLFTSVMIILVNLVSNLIWLSSKDLSISILTFFELFLSDIANGMLFFIIVIITFSTAFIITAIVRYFFPLDRRVSYAIAGFFGIMVMLQLTTLVFTGAILIAGMRSILGFLFFCISGLLGGYIYGLLLNKVLR
ncbi:MAG: hypothetical protein CML97_02270 [Rhodobiaceae bacterium]|nr:hypothetical protein [Rhodobiaceae bacterium]